MLAFLFVSFGGHFGTVWAAEDDFESMIADFPEDYKGGLRYVHRIYPNFVFYMDYIDEDYDNVVDHETFKKVPAANNAPLGGYNYADSYKAMYGPDYPTVECRNYNWETGQYIITEGAWTIASREITAYCMDPRNFLDEYNIFQFAKQSYPSGQSDDQVLAGINTIIEGTFLANTYEPDENDENDVRCGGNFAQVILEAGSKANVSPYVLAATILQEQGRGVPEDKIAELVRGTTKGHEGIYNFYNIGASGDTHQDVINNGFAYAERAGWNSRYNAIVGGAAWYASGYLSNRQDTYYYKDFNVLNGFSAYWHQYATNVFDASNSGKIFSELFEDENLRSATLEFRIPVYRNMPADNVSAPAWANLRANYYLLSLSGNLSPSFNMYKFNYSLSVSGDQTLVYKLPDGAALTSGRDFNLSAGNNYVGITVLSESGYTRTYNITVNASKACKLSLRTEAEITPPDEPQGDEDPEEPVVPTYQKGDANGDGKITPSDYITVKLHILGTKILSAEMMGPADANGDGKITPSDYITIKLMILNGN